MSRLQLAGADSSERLVEEIKAAEKDLRELKGRQRISLNNLIIHYNVGPVLTKAFADGDEYIFRVTYTPAQASAFSQLEVDIDVGGAGGSWHVYVWPEPNSQMDTSTKKWLVYFRNGGGSGTLNMGLFVRSFDIGTITWVEI